MSFCFSQTPLPEALNSKDTMKQVCMPTFNSISVVLGNSHSDHKENHNVRAEVRFKAECKHLHPRPER